MDAAMKKIVTDEMLSAAARNPGADQLFANDLGVGERYSLWKQTLPNMSLDMRLKMKYILDTWEVEQGREAGASKMMEVLGQTGRPDYRSLLDKLQVV